MGNNTITAFGGNAYCYSRYGEDTVQFADNPSDPSEYKNRRDPATGRGAVTDLVVDRDGDNYLIGVEHLSHW